MTYEISNSLGDYVIVFLDEYNQRLAMSDRVFEGICEETGETLRFNHPENLIIEESEEI